MAKQKTEAAPTEKKVGFRGFRNTPEVEALYRFINETDLRREGRLILEFVHSKLAKPKKTRKKRKSKKLQ